MSAQECARSNDDAGDQARPAPAVKSLSHGPRRRVRSVSNVEREAMPDIAVVEARTVSAPVHPLDPLTPDEIRRASAAVRKARDLGAGMMFETISLHEP